MNLKDKQNKINLISNMIIESEYGLLDKANSLIFNVQDINLIKKTLFQKSKISKGYEKELFYKLSIKLNTGNCKNMFKTLDNHFKKNKSIEPKSVMDYDSELNLEERSAKPIIVNAQDLPDYIREYLKDYVYLVDSTLNLVRIYFRNNIEYINEIDKIKKINESLSNLDLDVKIHFLSESAIIKNMSKIERKELDSFLDVY